MDRLFFSLFRRNGAIALDDFATITGTVTGLDRIPTSTSATIARAASVHQLRAAPDSPWIRTVRPRDPLAPRIYRHEVVVGAGKDLRSYLVRGFPSQSGIYAVGGVRRFTPIPGADRWASTFEPTHVGVALGVSSPLGGVISGADVELSIPIDRALTFEIVQPPGPLIRLTSFLYLPALGFIIIDDVIPEPDQRSVRMPASSGVLAGASHGLALYAEIDEVTSVRYVRSNDTHLIAGDWLRPPRGALLESRILYLTAPPAGAICTVQLRDRENVHWSYEAARSDLVELHFPEPPQGEPDRLAGADRLTVRCLRLEDAEVSGPIRLVR